MSEVSEVFLLDRATGQPVAAQLLDAVDVAFARRADKAWRAFNRAANAEALEKGVAMPRIEHEHWEWEAKVVEAGGLLAFATLGIELAGDVQGLMQLVTSGLHSRDAGPARRGLVYVGFLASAPWNVQPIVETPRYSGVGLVFLRAAIEMSLELDFKGRIGLHSLTQSEPWYERRGFKCFGPDVAKRGLKYYELTEERAKSFVREEHAT